MPQNKQKLRLEALRKILISLRNTEIAKIKEFRRDQADETLSVPGDEAEVARSVADIEMHASLIERSEERLKAIDAAFSRLEQGRYGICEQCGNEIPLERIRALPFARYCVEDQEKDESRLGSLSGSTESSVLRRWEPPEEYEKSPEEADERAEPEDELTVRASAFGPEEGELEELPSQPVRRGRRRKSA